MYRGRIAPSPTGLLHLGHAQTFATAQERCRAENGTLIYRNDDLDGPRCNPEFAQAAMDDLRWFGLDWDEGPYSQSERMPLYIEAFEKLRTGGWLFPCKCSRKEIAAALSAPHAGDEEPPYPGTCRTCSADVERTGVNWRFRVPAGREISFHDGHFGSQKATVGRDFGDILVWRKDDFPSYQLACVVDDALMGITEVVRGADLITSTFRQILIFEALGYPVPAFYHCPLVTDENGVRLAKRNDALSLRSLREAGVSPQSLQKIKPRTPLQKPGALG
jgi:glutamyl/glutaminyl-tRNA synthetase